MTQREKEIALRRKQRQKEAAEAKTREQMTQAGTHRYERVMAMVRAGRPDGMIREDIAIDAVTLSVYRKVVDGTISAGHEMTQVELDKMLAIGTHGKGVAQRRWDDPERQREKCLRKLRAVGYDKLKALGVDMGADPIVAWDEYQVKRMYANAAALKRRQTQERRRKREEAAKCRDGV